MKRRRFLTGLGAWPVAQLAAPPLTAALAFQLEMASAAERTRAGAFDPVELGLGALRAQLEQGLGSAALVTAYLERIARFDQSGPQFNSVLAVNPLALQTARALDAERRSGLVRGPLHGIPLLIKDNIATLDPLPTTAGSLALAAARHASDAPLVAKLRAAGAIILGKSNLSEWANFRSTRSISGWSAVGGQTRNAYDPLRTPSGSSSGSATAVALSLCAAGIGTETDGSILSPAALNGLVGFKPSVGAISGHGIVPLSPRQDVAGPMTRSVEDAAILAEVLFERPRPLPASRRRSTADAAPTLRVGYVPPPESLRPEVADAYARAAELWRGLGAELVDAPLPPGLDAAQDAEFTALLYEFKAALDEYLAALGPQRSAIDSLATLVEFNLRHADRELVWFGQEILEMALAKGPLTDPSYRAALSDLKRLVEVEGLESLFANLQVDVLVAPGGGPAALIDSVLGDRHDGGGSVLGSAAAIAGYPSITLPLGLVRGLPVGMTIVAPRQADERLLDIAAQFERAAGLRVPSSLLRG